MPQCPLALLMHEQTMLKTCLYWTNVQEYFHVQDSFQTTHIEYTNTYTLINAFYTQLYSINLHTCLSKQYLNNKT